MMMMISTRENWHFDCARKPRNAAAPENTAKFQLNY